MDCTFLTRFNSTRLVNNNGLILLKRTTMLNIATIIAVQLFYKSQTYVKRNGVSRPSKRHEIVNIYVQALYVLYIKFHFVACLGMILPGSRAKTRQRLGINPLSTKMYLYDLKIHFVPRSKHSMPRFEKPIS